MTKWFKLFFLFPFTFFVTGAVVPSGGGEAPPAGEGTEGAEGDGSEESVEEGVEGAEEVEGGGEEPESGEGKPVPKAASEKVDWRSVPQEVKAHLQELGKSNPKLGNLLQNAVYTSQTFLREFPGGLKEAKGLKTSIETLGGVEEIQNLHTAHKQLITEQEDLDRRAASGDPEVLNVLADVAGDGFVKLMEPALSLWNQKDPAGYAHSIAKLLVSTLSDGGVVSSLNLVHKMLALNTPEATKMAMEELKRASDYMNQIGDVASKPPEKPKVDPIIAAGKKEIEDGRAKLFTDKFNTRFQSWRNPQITKAIYATAPRGSKFTQDQLNVLGKEIVNEVKGVLAADGEYIKTLERLFNSRDEEALFKFTSSRTMKVLDQAAKRVYGRLYRNITPAKKAATGAPGQKTEPGTAQKRTAATTGTETKGWTKISADKAPDPNDIDNTKTDFKMKFKKQAFLKDGRKVYWGDSVPAA